MPKEKTRPKYSTKQPPWVDPAVFFDQLTTVMKQVPPMPGEEALYKWIGSVLDAAAEDLEVLAHSTTAFAAAGKGRRAAAPSSLRAAWLAYPACHSPGGP
jgi:hypothetical protein